MEWLVVGWWQVADWQVSVDVILYFVNLKKWFHLPDSPPLSNLFMKIRQNCGVVGGWWEGVVRWWWLGRCCRPRMETQVSIDWFCIMIHFNFIKTKQVLNDVFPVLIQLISENRAKSSLKNPKKGLSRVFHFFIISSRFGHYWRDPWKLQCVTFFYLAPCSVDVCIILRQDWVHSCFHLTYTKTPFTNPPPIHHPWPTIHHPSTIHPPLIHHLFTVQNQLTIHSPQK